MLASVNIYMKAFTYLVVLKSTGQFYYGTRFAKNCDPSELWSTYFTSSKLILDLVDSLGPDAFDYSIRKVFDNAQAALNWEQRVISKFLNHPLCLNKGYFGKTIIRDHEGNLKAASKAVDTKRKTICSNGLSILENAGKKLSATLKENPDIVKKRTQKMLTNESYIQSRRELSERLKINNPAFDPDVREKISDSVREYLKNNEPAFKGHTHTEKFKQHMSESRMGKGNPCFNKIWVNDGKVNKRVLESDMPVGFVKGRLPLQINRTERTCPHCGKVGKGPNMSRYHFDKCKQRKI